MAAELPEFFEDQVQSPGRVRQKDSSESNTCLTLQRKDLTECLVAAVAAVLFALLLQVAPTPLNLNSANTLFDKN